MLREESTTNTKRDPFPGTPKKCVECDCGFVVEVVVEPMPPLRKSVCASWNRWVGGLLRRSTLGRYGAVSAVAAAVCESSTARSSAGQLVGGDTVAEGCFSRAGESGSWGVAGARITSPERYISLLAIENSAKQMMSSPWTPALTPQLGMARPTCAPCFRWPSRNLCADDRPICGVTFRVLSGSDNPIQFCQLG